MTLVLRAVRSSVRHVRQTELAECGLACLAMVAARYGYDVDLAALRREYGTSQRGSTIKSLVTTADALGLIPRPVKLPLESLEDLHLPAILHWNLNHFVVLEKVANGRAYVHDPAGGSKWLKLSAVSDHFTGIALELRPSASFEPVQARQRLKITQLWNRITGLRRSLVQTLVLTLTLQAYVLASPYYMQVAVDQAVPAQDANLLAVLALGFGLFALVNVGASLLRAHVLLYAGTSLGFGLAVNLARRLFRLPVEWFERRQIGDVLSRFQSVKPIQDALTQGVIAAVVDGVLAILVLAVMFIYSPLLASIALAAFAIYVGIRLVTFQLQRDAQEDVIAAGAKEQSTIIETLRGIVTLRLFGREAERHAFWQNRSSETMNAQLRLAKIGIGQSCANSLVGAAENILTIWLAAKLAMSGGFSIGMIFAYLAYKGQFIGKANSLVDQLIAFRMLGLHLERLSDIALSDEDTSFKQTSVPPGEFDGSLQLRDVTYRYAVSEPLVVDRVSFTVSPGEHVAITGPSGGGKSTLLKVMLGLLDPESGEVVAGGRPLDQFGHAAYRSHVAAVLQDDNLFAGSIAENIALFDDDYDMLQIQASAQMAALHDEITQMPMGYDTLVGDMGSTLSGGQRARLLLARALYRKPKILFMDEGTAHLDPAKEAAVSQTIAELGITRVVIAHRAETIRHADRVLVMVKGLLSEIPRTVQASAD